LTLVQATGLSHSHDLARNAGDKCVDSLVSRRSGGTIAWAYSAQFAEIHGVDLWQLLCSIACRAAIAAAMGHRMIRVRLLWVIVCASLAAACGGSQRGEIAAATPERAEVAPADMPASSDAPHGDHNPHHGGVVYMNGELHYEVVLDLQGHHRMYFSDAAREDLPAAVARSVTLTIGRPGQAPETVPGTIDPQGESWLLDGAPIESSDASVRVAFTANGEDYWIDVPFIASAQ
jgi:hypothetical protein